jgi:hypothetical protein
MAQRSFPFDNSDSWEEQWTKMAQHWLATGVIKSLWNELQVYADSTGMQVKVKTGAAWVKGHYYESDAEEVLAIGTAHATNPRIDRVVLRLDWTSNSILLAVLQGTAAVSPVAPNLTQNSSRWEISLAQVRVNAAVSTIAADKITDERIFTDDNPYFFIETGQWGLSTDNALFLLPIGANLKQSKGITLGTNQMIINKAGKYYIDYQLELTGLNYDQTVDTIIRHRVGSGYGDKVRLLRGFQTALNNNGGILIDNSVIIDAAEGDRVEFYARTTQTPRNVVVAKVSCFKISG